MNPYTAVELHTLRTCSAYQTHNNRRWLATLDGVRAGERKAIAEYLRTAARACGVLIDINSEQDIARLAVAIERGDHAADVGAEVHR